MAKIFVHIGLPKTATSSLQMDLFPRLENEKLKYLGRREIEGQDEHVLFSAFYESVCTGKNIEAVKTQLITYLKEDISLLISEEMIVLSQGNVTWRNKLNNLEVILEGLNYCIIVTVRNPVEALFSYYVEMYQKYEKSGHSFVDLALHDENMEIFHYGKLFHEIGNQFALENVFVKPFEDIISGKLYDVINLLAEIGTVNRDIEIAHKNARASSKDAVVSHYDHTLASVIKNNLRRFGLLPPKVVELAGPVLRPVNMALDYVKLGKVKVKTPSQIEFDQIQRALAQETSELNRLFNIDYT